VNDWDDADDEGWIAEQRARVASYLEGQGIRHGGLAQEPTWYVSPYLAIWPIGSIRAPGAVGWWAISGDCPTDYCSSKSCRYAREAAHHFAETWRDAASDPREDGTLGATGLPVHLRDLLASRAKILAEFVEDHEIWLLAEDD